jgi:hypothetical protein
MNVTTTSDHMAAMACGATPPIGIVVFGFLFTAIVDDVPIMRRLSFERSTQEDGWRIERGSRSSRGIDSIDLDTFRTAFDREIRQSAASTYTPLSWFRAAQISIPNGKQLSLAPGSSVKD